MTIVTYPKMNFKSYSQAFFRNRQMRCEREMEDHGESASL